jgi:hypothetical protein
MFTFTEKQIKLFKMIETKGRLEQERQYLFLVYDGSKAVTRRTRGMYKEFDNREKFAQKRRADKIKRKKNKSAARDWNDMILRINTGLSGIQLQVN